MKIIEGMEQGTPEWLEFRKSHLGASDIGTIMNLNPYDSRLRLWEEKTLGVEKKCSPNMKRGQVLEPLARQEYILQKGIVVNPIVAEDTLFPFLSASFDGISDDLQIAVEIKCGKKSYEMAMNEEIPPYYYAQMQHQMMIANLKEIDYFCFNGKDGILIRIEVNKEFISDMLDKSIEFWHCITSFQPPED